MSKLVLNVFSRGPNTEVFNCYEAMVNVFEILGTL